MHNVVQLYYKINVFLALLHQFWDQTPPAFTQGNPQLAQRLRFSRKDILYLGGIISQYRIDHGLSGFRIKSHAGGSFGQSPVEDTLS